LGPRILLIGSSGFVGRAIVLALRRADKSDVLLASRTSDGNENDSYAWRNVDIRDAAEVRKVCEGRSAIIHSASYIGHDPELQTTINVDGTRNLVNAAKQAGVERFLYMSTAAVYGDFDISGGDENCYIPNPQSSLSVSRYKAEQLVLEAGGVVVRPQYVYGVGDRWFLGLLVQVMGYLGAWIDHGQARVSVISSDALGTAVAMLIGRNDFAVLPRVFHAAYSCPVSVHHIVGTLMESVGVTPPVTSVSYSNALIQLRHFGLHDGQIRGIGRDKFVNSDRLWSFVNEPIPESFHSKMVTWYRASVTSDKAY
jgi:nucleoside-diphosphate-sugar epimerase